MSIAPGQKLTGPEKAAILLLSLSEEYTTKIMGQLDDHEIRDVSLIMATLGTIPSDTVENVCAEFTEGISGQQPLTGTLHSTERALNKVMDKTKVDAIMKDIQLASGQIMWKDMGHIDDDILANYLKNEYPQTIAVVLSKLRTDQAAKLISLLPEQLAVDVMLRLLKLDHIQSDVLHSVEQTLKQDFLSGAVQKVSHDPYETIADIFSSFDRKTEAKYMSLLEECDGEAAARIKSLIFSFDDLGKLNSPSIQTIINNVDKAQLALALKGAPEEVRILFLTNMSERTSKLLREDIEALGMVKLRSIDEAQAHVLDTTKRLARRDKITLPVKGDFLTRNR